MLLRLSSALIGFSELAQQLGANPAELCARAGLDPSYLHTTNQFIRCETFNRLLEVAAQATGREDFGLLLGREINLAVMGPTGFIIQHAGSVMEALNGLRRYNHLHDQGTLVQLTTDHGKAYFSSRNLAASDEAFQVTDRAAGLGMAVMRMLGGPDWSPDKVLFRHRAPADTGLYQKVFGCPVLFGQEENALVFDADFLDAPMTQESNSYTNQIVQDYIRRLEGQAPRDLISKVRLLIQQLLGTNGCSLVKIADSLRVSKRSLQRHLNQQGTSFSELVESVRIDMAQQYLTETNMSLTQLAELLGYTETSNFSRAFKRRVGLAPLAWKKVASAGVVSGR